MIAEIKKVFAAQKVVSLFGLSVILKKDPQTLTLALEQLVRKKYLQKVESSCGGMCSGCAGCDRLKTEFYKKNGERDFL